MAEHVYRLFTIYVNSAIANNLKPIGMMKMQCVTMYPNIYECVSDMMIRHDRFWTFYGHFANEARKLRINKTKWEQFPRKKQIVQNIIWMISISFRKKRLPCRSVSDWSRSLNCLYRKQSEKCSAKCDRGLIHFQNIGYALWFKALLTETRMKWIHGRYWRKPIAVFLGVFRLNISGQIVFK